MTTAESLEVAVENKDGLKRELSFQVPSAAVDAALNTAYDTIARTVRIPGFRNGKVPRQVIRSRYQAQASDEVLQNLIPDYYRQAVEQAELQPVGNPEFGKFDVQEGQPLAVTVTMEVRPEFELATYEKLALTGPDTSVSDHDIVVAHESLQGSMATLEPTAKDHKAVNGNVTMIDFAGSVDGTPFDGGTAQGFSLELGEGRFIPGFEEQILGHKAGDSFDVNVTFPDEYHEPTLAAKAAMFAVTVTDIKQKTLPEVNDEFATQVGDFADLETLNATLREQIQAKREHDSRKSLRQQALGILAEAHTFDPPESMIEEEVDILVDTAMRMAAMQGNADFDREGAREEQRSEAIVQARARLVVDEIAKRETVAVSEEEFNAEIQRLAREYQRPPDEVNQLVRQNPQETARLRAHLLKDKVLNLVVDRAKVTTTDRTDDAPAKKTKAKKAPAKKTAAKKAPAKKAPAKKKNTKSEPK